MENMYQVTAVDGLGVLGFLTYAIAELMLAFRKIHSDQIVFYLLYGLGAALILSSLMWNFNAGAFLAETFSLMICFVAIAVRLRAPRRAPTARTRPPVSTEGGPRAAIAGAAFHMPPSHARAHRAPLQQPPTR